MVDDVFGIEEFENILNFYGKKKDNGNNCDSKNCDGRKLIDPESKKFICNYCGKVYDDAPNTTISVNEAKKYNVGTSSQSLRYTGPHAKALQKCLYSSGSNYAPIKRKNVRRTFMEPLYQYDGVDQIRDIIKEAIEMFLEIPVIVRGDIRRGIMGMCLYYKSLEYEKVMLRSEIMECMRVSSNDLSRGDKKLKMLEAQGSIKLPSEENILRCYIKKYSLRFDITEKRYKKFIYMLIKFTNIKKISQSSLLNSKCAGAFHILSIYSDIGLTTNMISEVCRTSIPTFLKFSNEVISIINGSNRRHTKSTKQIRDIFARYDLKIE